MRHPRVATLLLAATALVGTCAAEPPIPVSAGDGPAASGSSGKDADAPGRLEIPGATTRREGTVTPTRPPAPAVPAKGPAAEPPAYEGPGRDEPEPEDLSEVRIGWFGPSDAAHPDGDLFLAASLAIEEANAAGGHHGLPFRLVPAWSESPWTAGASHVTRLVYEDEVVAVIGSPDGASTHLAEQVVAKAWAPLVSPVASDRSVNLASVPWVFSIAPDDRGLAAALAPAVAAAALGGRVALVSSTDHDARAMAAEMRAALESAGAAARAHHESAPGAADADDVARRVAEGCAAAAVVIAPPADAARHVAALRAASPSLAIFGGASIERPAFLAAAGPAAEGITAALACDPSAIREPFAGAFAARAGRAPDCAAAAAHDAAAMIVAAVRSAGVNRARVRDALAALAPWEGASGLVRWDRLNRNERPAALGVVRDGRVLPLR